MTINVAKEFTVHPGPRYPHQGQGSGEEFRDKHLKPKFLAAVKKEEPLIVELDGVEFGYPTSFLEEAFGGLAREFGVEVVQKALVFRSVAEPILEVEIRHYITHAKSIGPLDDVDY